QKRSIIRDDLFGAAEERRVVGMMLDGLAITMIDCKNMSPGDTIDRFVPIDPCEILDGISPGDDRRARLFRDESNRRIRRAAVLQMHALAIDSGSHEHGIA